jgi:hypothetical protein
MYYSKQKNAFFASEFRSDYEAAGSWPDDAVEIGRERHAELITAQSSGGTIQPGADGFPIAVMPLPLTAEQIREYVLKEIREQRAPIMTILDGIAGRAMRQGDAELAAAADDAGQALRDITTDPEFLAAETAEDMKAAILSRYRAIAEAAPVEVRTAFREVIGS